jgi:hypothetical protein
LAKNEPLLAEVRAPWDAGWGLRELIKPKNLGRAIFYGLRYRWFWAPTSMDPWRYRRFLKDLDEVCLRALKSHGALTARELANWLNRENLLRTKPELTGINRISVATVHDWLSLACRRGYVVLWSGGVGAARGASQEGSHWKLTDRGREAIHSRLMTLISRLPYASWIPLAIGGLAGALEWITLHEVVIIVMVYALLLGLAIAIPHLWVSRSEKRENPGIAVVAIETLRSSNKPIPRL